MSTDRAAHRIEPLASRRSQMTPNGTARDKLPKLFVNADPGAILTGALREFCRAWPGQTEVTVPGSHIIREDCGPATGRAIVAWAATLPRW